MSSTLLDNATTSWQLVSSMLACAREIKKSGGLFIKLAEVLLHLHGKHPSSLILPFLSGLFICPVQLPSYFHLIFQVSTINHGFASFPQFQQKWTWALDTKIDCGDGYTTL